MPALTAPAAVSQFRGPGVVLTVGADRIEVQQTSLWRRLFARTRRESIARWRITDAQVLTWGKALLLVTADGRALTVELGEQTEAACVALSAS